MLATDEPVFDNKDRRTFHQCAIDWSDIFKELGRMTTIRIEDSIIAGFQASLA
jgi:hypothetical protein